jgi:PrsW family intramembrane metalloprotease
MRRPPGIYDPAAQLERIALAWNRASQRLSVPAGDRLPTVGLRLRRRPPTFSGWLSSLAHPRLGEGWEGGLASLFVVRGGQLSLSLTSVVLTELVRGVLAPFGHGLWTAILGGVIFHGARRGHLRLTWSMLGAYLGVSILHAAFDSLGGVPGYIVISILGLLPLVYLWWRGDRTGWIELRERVVQPQAVASEP